MRPRTQIYDELYISSEDIKKLTHGYTIHKRANKHAHALIPHNPVYRRLLKMRADLDKRLAMYENKPILTTNKRPYTKRDKDFWERGGNKQYLKPRQKSMEGVHGNS